jgi:hypothetical protein
MGVCKLPDRVGIKYRSRDYRRARKQAKGFYDLIQGQPTVELSFDVSNFIRSRKINNKRVTYFTYILHGYKAVKWR